MFTHTNKQHKQDKNNVLRHTTTNNTNKIRIMFFDTQQTNNTNKIRIMFLDTQQTNNTNKIRIMFLDTQQTTQQDKNNVLRHKQTTQTR